MDRCKCVVAVIAVFMSAWCGAVAADSVYRWVDKEGKVHYSKTPPSDAPTAQSRVEVLDTKSTSDESTAPPGHSKSQDCTSMKCLGDRMEADRRKREHEYERQRDKNTKAEMKEKKYERYDDVMRQNCLNLGASTKTNCNDKKEVRKLYGQ